MNKCSLQNVSRFQKSEIDSSLELGAIDRISPDYLDEWKEKTSKRQAFELFIEYFSIKQKVPFKEFISKLEKTILIHTLSRFNGNQKDAAKFLGMKYTTLNEKLKKYNIRFRKIPIKG